MTHRTLELLSSILEYPAVGYSELACGCCLAVEESVEGGNREAICDALNRFRDGISSRSRGELEELYTRTFDLNPACSLDLGWHLYAENYDRGTFLVAMREALRRFGIPETQELPDHLPAVLKLLARMPEKEGRTLVHDSVLPAMRKMISGFSEQENPYGSLMQAIEVVLVDAYPLEQRSIQL